MEGDCTITCAPCVIRAWVEYKHGFGDLFSPEGEFWLGNEPLHHLTTQGVCSCYCVCACLSHYGMVAHIILCLLGNYDLRIDMEDFEGNQRFAEYKNFRVDDEKVRHGRRRTTQG